MLRGLLADRFKLVVHNEDKPQPAFAMTASKGVSGIESRLKQWGGSGTQGCMSPPAPPNIRPSPDEPVTFSCRGESMTAFAQFLHELVRIDLRQPVVDTTGLTGLWDFDVKLPYAHPWGSVYCLAVIQAIDDELGLKIAAGTAPLPVMIVDSVNEQPTPNMPGLQTAMPPLPPAEFEVRKLLEDRLDIRSHMEGYPAEAYALLADKPTMKTSNPQGRSGCKEGPGPDGKDPRIAKPILVRLVSRQNVTMAQFAEMLARGSNGDIKIPVFDPTGLTGSYDFVVSFSGYSQVGGINAYSLPTPTPADTATSSTSTDPTGGLLLLTHSNSSSV